MTDLTRPQPTDPQPTLHTARLLLRPFDQSDAPTVERLCGDYAVAQMTASIEHPYPAGGAERWIARRERQWRGREQVSFAIVERG